MTQQPKTSGMAIAALITAFFCGPIIAIPLGIIAISQINKSNGQLKGTGLAIAGIVASLVFIVPAMLAAIAIPNFMKFQCRSKQSEARTQLKSLYVAEESYRGEFNKYSTSFEEVGFQVFSQNPRYEYKIDVGGGEAEPTFKATATGIRDGVEGDVWVVDNNNRLENVNNACP